MEKPPRPPKELIPSIPLMRWKPDQEAMDVAMGKKPEAKNDRRPNY